MLTRPSKDLKSIHDFIALDSFLYAKKFVGLIRQRVAVLNEHPQSGHPFHADKFDELRQILFKSYRIVYHFQNNAVTILAIQHQSRSTDHIVSLDPFKK